jgi:hypothetical protein
MKSMRVISLPTTKLCGRSRSMTFVPPHIQGSLQ